MAAHPELIYDLLTGLIVLAAATYLARSIYLFLFCRTRACASCSKHECPHRETSKTS